jgi:hypothetical protein
MKSTKPPKTMMAAPPKAMAASVRSVRRRFRNTLRAASLK